MSRPALGPTRLYGLSSSRTAQQCRREADSSSASGPEFNCLYVIACAGKSLPLPLHYAGPLFSVYTTIICMPSKALQQAYTSDCSVLSYDTERFVETLNTFVLHYSKWRCGHNVPLFLNLGTRWGWCLLS